MNCKFCEKICKNDNSLRNHERLCKLNPNRQFTPFQSKEFQKNRKKSNQYISAKENGEQYSLSEETRKKMSENGKNRTHTEETKQKLSKKAKENGLGGVTQSRWIKYKGKTLGSSYELELAKDLDINSIEWDTCSRFKYIDLEGKERSYTPDIYLPEFDIYLDPKNDFLIENINPSLGFKDADKIQWVCAQNDIKVYILNKDQLSWNYVKTLLDKPE